MTNFSQLTSQEFARVMRLHGDYTAYALKHMLIAARNGSVPPSVAEAFMYYVQKSTSNRDQSREEAREDGEKTYHGQVHEPCGNTLRHTSSGRCVTCTGDKDPADQLRDEIIDFIKKYGRRAMRGKYPAKGETLIRASASDSDLSSNAVRSYLRLSMREIEKRLAAMEANA